MGKLITSKNNLEKVLKKFCENTVDLYFVIFCLLKANMLKLDFLLQNIVVFLKIYSKKEDKQIYR